jgi:hypothetical protein
MDKSKFNEQKEWRKFGVGLGIILGAIGSIQLLKGHSVYPFFIGAGALTALAAIVVPILIKPVFIFFSYLSVVLGWFSTRLILTVIFFVLLTPISIIMKLTGKKFLTKGADRNLPTYWIDRNKTDGQPESFENQF